MNVSGRTLQPIRADKQSIRDFEVPIPVPLVADFVGLLGMPDGDIVETSCEIGGHFLLPWLRPDASFAWAETRAALPDLSIVIFCCKQYL